MQAFAPLKTTQATTQAAPIKQPGICPSPRSLVEELIPHASEHLKQKVCVLMVAIQSEQNSTQQ